MPSLYEIVNLAKSFEGKNLIGPPPLLPLLKDDSPDHIFRKNFKKMSLKIHSD